MRGVPLALAFAIIVSLTALAQQPLAIAPDAQSSRALSAASYLDRGNGWLNKGEFERAIADYSLAIVFDAGNAGAYYNRGMARAGKGDLDGALRDFDQSIMLDASDPQAWLTRGVIRAQEKDYARALADFDQAIKLAPRLAEAWHNRAVTLMWMDKLPEAEADFARFSEFGGKLKPEAEQLWREVKERLKQK